MAPEKIIIIGTSPYRTKVFNQLQSLTSQKLSLTSKGEIVLSGSASGGSKPVGTKLVKNLMDSKHDIIIELPKFGKGNGTKFSDWSAAVNPKGEGSGSKISFDPNDKGQGVVNEDASKGRPAQVGLGHFEADRKIGEKVDFNDLTIVELNLSGERYQRPKYLLASCKENTTVLRCHLEQGKWIFDPVYIKKASTISNVIHALNSSVDKGKSWLQSINDILCITRLKSGGEVEVKIYGTLTETQLTLIGDINE